VVRKQGGRNTNNDRYVYINVDDNATPIVELRRLLDLNLGYLYQDQTFKRIDRATSSPRAMPPPEPHATCQSPGRVPVLGLLEYTAGNKPAASPPFAPARSSTPNPPTPGGTARMPVASSSQQSGLFAEDFFRNAVVSGAAELDGSFRSLQALAEFGSSFEPERKAARRRACCRRCIRAGQGPGTRPAIGHVACGSAAASRADLKSPDPIRLKVLVLVEVAEVESSKRRSSTIGVALSSTLM